MLGRRTVDAAPTPIQKNSQMGCRQETQQALTACTHAYLFTENRTIYDLSATALRNLGQAQLGRFWNVSRYADDSARK